MRRSGQIISQIGEGEHGDVVGLGGALGEVVQPLAQVGDEGLRGAGRYGRIQHRLHLPHREEMLLLVFAFGHAVGIQKERVAGVQLVFGLFVVVGFCFKDWRILGQTLNVSGGWQVL